MGDFFSPSEQQTKQQTQPNPQGMALMQALIRLFAQQYNQRQGMPQTFAQYREYGPRQGAPLSFLPQEQKQIPGLTGSPGMGSNLPPGVNPQLAALMQSLGLA